MIIHWIISVGLVSTVRKQKRQFGNKQIEMANKVQTSKYFWTYQFELKRNYVENIKEKSWKESEKSKFGIQTSAAII